MIDLPGITTRQLETLSEAIVSCGGSAATMEACARNIVRSFYDGLGLGAQDRACALVRCFKTQRFEALPEDLKDVALQSLESGAPDPDLKCLVLLATAGDEHAWNSRHTSAAHKAIPLPSAKMVARFPMISQLMKQLGVDVKRVLRSTDGLIVDRDERMYNVFFVPDAQDSPHIPAQEQFVKPFAIRSVLGFGGILPAGDLFAFVLFTRVVLPRAKADLFKPLAVSAKTALLQYEDAVFD